MKLGILTFHSQLNYGGVLQCWALKTALEGMGHEVVVVDRWVTPDNRMLDGPFGHAGFKGWCMIALKSLLGCGTGKQALRHWRTRRFMKLLNLTSFHFYDWAEVEQANSQTIERLDSLVVGSDQVWHGGDWGDPRPYLLEGAPQVHAIAYAASFGIKAMPAAMGLYWVISGIMSILSSVIVYYMFTKPYEAKKAEIEAKKDAVFKKSGKVALAGAEGDASAEGSKKNGKKKKN